VPIFLVRARRVTTSAEIAQFTIQAKDRDEALRKVHGKLDRGEAVWEDYGEPRTERGYVPKDWCEVLADGDEDVSEK
jgi:hypothetical protein